MIENAKEFLSQQAEIRQMTEALKEKMQEMLAGLRKKVEQAKAVKTEDS